MKTTSPEKILEIARRHVGIREKKRNFGLFWGIGASALYIAFFAFIIKDPRAYFQSLDSFLWGILFGVSICLLPVPGGLGVALFIRKYADEYVLSKRLIKLEDEGVKESKSRQFPRALELSASKRYLTEQGSFSSKRGRKVRTTSPVNILESARRRVDLSEARRYFVLFLGIGWCVLLIGIVGLFAEEPEAYSHCTESFIEGIAFGIMLIIANYPTVLGVAVFFNRYHYDYIVSKRIIELEEEKFRENKS